jgi:A/G-specific adenine glycosylase
LEWYAKEGRTFPWREKTATKYKQIIAELLLQRTRAETVSRYYDEFVRRYPSWSAISKEDTKKFAETLKPLGLWKRRAFSIKSVASSLANNRYPKYREELETIGGIGQYIANAILLACHGEAQPLLDVNMARVLERVFGKRNLADIRYDPYLQTLSRAVVRCKEPKRINWAILDLAALVCMAHDPECTNCPTRYVCRHLKEETEI